MHRMSKIARMDRCNALWFALALAAPPCHAQEQLRDREIHDSDTLAWWHTTVALSEDGMEGRDTGSAAYQRAADYVANRFKTAGLTPAGENGSYFQAVPMHEIAVVPEGTSFTHIGANATPMPLQFLQEITITPATDLPTNFHPPLTSPPYSPKD